MESEGQGGTTKENPMPKSASPSNRTTTVSIPSGTVMK